MKAPKLPAVPLSNVWGLQQNECEGRHSVGHIGNEGGSPDSYTEPHGKNLCLPALGVLAEIIDVVLYISGHIIECQDLGSHDTDVFGADLSRWCSEMWRIIFCIKGRKNELKPVFRAEGVEASGFAGSLLSMLKRFPFSLLLIYLYQTIIGSS